MQTRPVVRPAGMRGLRGCRTLSGRAPAAGPHRRGVRQQQSFALCASCCGRNHLQLRHGHGGGVLRHIRDVGGRLNGLLRLRLRMHLLGLLQRLQAMKPEPMSTKHLVDACVGFVTSCVLSPPCFLQRRHLYYVGSGRNRASAAGRLKRLLVGYNSAKPH